MKVAESPLSQRSKEGDLLHLRTWLVARGTVKMATPKQSSLGTRLWMNFLTYHGIFWNLRPPKNATSEKFWWWELGVAVDLNKYEICGERNERCKNFWLFPSMQCSRDVENPGKVSMH